MQDRKARHAMPAAGEASADFLDFKPEPKASALPAAVAPELAAPPAAVESGPDVAPPYGVGKLTRSVHLRSGRSPQLNALRDLLVGNALAQEGPMRQQPVLVQVADHRNPLLPCLEDVQLADRVEPVQQTLLLLLLSPSPRSRA